MLKLSEKELLDKIKAGDTFEANLPDNSLTLKIEAYVPYLCAAIYNGTQLRTSLVSQLLLSEKERKDWEAPQTGEIIASLPITITANDSRFEYDLNRNEKDCFLEAIGDRNLWGPDLPPAEVEISRQKHRRFYAVLSGLFEELQRRFGEVAIYDIRSQKTAAGTPRPPLFNIGCHFIDQSKWGKVLANLQKKLEHIRLNNIGKTTAITDETFGAGFLAEYIQGKHFRTLHFPVQVEKIYTDPQTGELFPQTLFELKVGLKEAILQNAAYFTRKRTSKSIEEKHELLSPTIHPGILKLDKDLYHLCRGVQALRYINPVNLPREKKRFFKNHYNYEPRFKYRHLKIDPYEFRRKLYHVPIESIQDVTLQGLYKEVIDSFACKIDLLTSLGTEHFLYNSLRYYGEPTERDLKNAEFILHSGEFDQNQNGDLFTAEEAAIAFRQEAERYGIECSVELSTSILSGALVNNGRKAIMIHKNETWTSRELKALIHHELGVHLITTLNAETQPLQILRLGLPENTQTQEGLAILSEYLSGNFTLGRLRVLALRVLAVHSLLKTNRFSRTFKMLVDEYGTDPDTAFSITARVYRGGGCTKDFLYLSGLRQAYHFYNTRNIDNLFIGKTSFKYLDILNELRSRNILNPLKFLPNVLSFPKPENPIMNHLVSSIH